MRTEQLEVVLLYRGDKQEDITKAASRSITVDWQGIVGDARHRGDVRGDGGCARKWSACARNEIEQIRLNWNALLVQHGIELQLSSIDPGWLGANIVFSDRANFSSHFPHVFKFPSGLELYASMTNEPCIHAGMNIIRQV